MQRYPGQKVNLAAAEVNRWNVTANAYYLSRLGLEEGKLPDDPYAWWVWVRNDSGLDRERFDCMSLGEPLYEMKEDGTVDLLFEGFTADPDPDKTAVILLEPIAADAYGKGVIHGLALAWVGPGTGLWAQPNPEEHNLTPGAGNIKLLATPSETEVKLLPVLLGGGGLETKFFTLLEDMPSGHDVFAWAVLEDWEGNELQVAKLYNWSSFGLNLGIIDGAQAGYWGTAEFQQGKWRFEQGPCILTCNTEGSISGDAPDGTVGEAYSFSPDITGMDADSLSGSRLPDGLSVGTDGTISGTPTEAGTFHVVILGTAPKIYDDGTCTITKVFVITIAEE